MMGLNYPGPGLTLSLTGYDTFQMTSRFGPEMADTAKEGHWSSASGPFSVLSARQADALLLAETELTATIGREVIYASQGIMGVDSHQDEHVAIVIYQQGGRLALHYAPATRDGYGEPARRSWKLGELGPSGSRAPVTAATDLAGSRPVEG